MPQFTTKNKFHAVTLVACGIVLLLLARDLILYGFIGFILAYISWLMGGALVGAGLLMPFRKPWLGAGVGVISLFLWLGILAAMHATN
jgi:hypothetical protein